MIPKMFKFDWVQTVSVLLLLGIGLISLFSVSTVDNHLDLEHFRKQFVAIFIGLMLWAIFAFSDYRVLNQSSTRLYFIGLASLVLVLLIGKTVRGNTGWLGIGSFNIQPIEVIKLVIIIFFASFFSKKKMEFAEPGKIFTAIVFVAVPLFLILKQPDFGSASIMIAIWAGMLFVSGISKKSVAIILASGALIMAGSFFFMKDYQKDRLLNFIDPYRDPRGSGYNVIQSTVAVGSGGMFGKGLGHGSQSQLNFLPEKHTDFIFSAIAEETGFFGSIFTISLFIVLLYRIKETARLARDNFGYLLSVGISLMLFAQIFINIGMNIGIAPVAGVPLPLLSYGGSSMVMTLASLGIIQSIYVRRLKE